MLGQQRLRSVAGDQSVVDSGGRIVLSLGIEFRAIPVALRLLGADFGPHLHDPVLFILGQLIGELHECLVGQDLRLIQDASLVARPLIGTQFGLETEQMGLQQKLAVGVFVAEQAVKIVGIHPLAIDEMSVGLRHDAVVGQRAAGIVDANVVKRLDTPATRVEDRPAAIDEIGCQRPVAMFVVQRNPELRDDKLPLRDAVEVAGIGIFFDDLVVAVFCLGILIGEEPALRQLPHRIFLDGGVGPAVDRRFIFRDRFLVFAVAKQGISLGQRGACDWLVGSASHHLFPAAFDIFALEVIPARFRLGGLVLRGDDRGIGILSQFASDLFAGVGPRLRPGPCWHLHCGAARHKEYAAEGCDQKSATSRGSMEHNRLLVQEGRAVRESGDSQRLTVSRRPTRWER